MSLIGLVVSEKMFENVDGRRTDAGVTGILLAHQWAFSSGEQKKKQGEFLFFIWRYNFLYGGLSFLDIYI